MFRQKKYSIPQLELILTGFDISVDEAIPERAHNMPGAAQIREWVTGLSIKTDPIANEGVILKVSGTYLYSDGRGEIENLSGKFVPYAPNKTKFNYKKQISHKE